VLAGWTLIPATEDQKRRFNDIFTHPKTDAFTLLCLRPNYSEWTDKQGATHREYIHKECIFLWVMPGDFKPQFPRSIAFNFVFPPAQLVYASPEVRVYGRVDQYTTNTNRAKQILKEATRISCPEVQPSWTSWQSDIAAKLQK
jgi:hypothetical protein